MKTFLILLFGLISFLYQTNASKVTIVPKKALFDVGTMRFLTCSFVEGEEKDDDDYFFNWDKDEEEEDETGSEDLVFKWKKDGEDLKTTDRISIEVIGKSSMLDIRSVHVKDSGTYSCEVLNSQGQSLATQTARIMTLTPISFHHCSGTQAFKLNSENIDLRCGVGGIPKPMIRWILPNGEKVKLKNDSLHLNKMSKDKGGQYIVRAKQLPVGSTQEKVINVVVYEPVVIEMEKITNWKINDTITIRCKATASPVANTITISKLQDGKEYLISSDENTVFENQPGYAQVVFRKAKQTDNGVYVCKASNGYSNAKDIQTVQVEWPAKITKFDNLTVSSGKLMQIKCHVSGFKLPEVHISRIYENGTVVLLHNESLTHFEYPETSHVVTYEVASASLENEGVYKCQIFQPSLNHQREQTMSVEILYKPHPVLAPSPEPFYTWQSNPIKLNCSVKANPSPNFQWILEKTDGSTREIRVSSPLPANSSPSSEPYVINEIQEDQKHSSLLTVTPQNDGELYYGIYTCKASNSEGEFDAPFNLKQASVPSQPNKIELVEKTATTLKVAVTDGFNGGVPIDNYTVEYFKATTNETPVIFNALRDYSQEKGLILLKNLIRETNYSVTIEPANPVGLGYKKTIFLETDKLSAPERVLLNMDKLACHHPKMVTIKWHKPYSSGLDIKEYKVSYRVKNDGEKKKTKVEEWTTTYTKNKEFKLRDAEPSSEYEVKVQARNDVGLSPDDKITSFHVCKGEDQQSIPVTGSSKDSSSKNGWILLIVAGLVFLVALICDVVCCLTNKCGVTRIIYEKFCGGGGGGPTNDHNKVTTEKRYQSLNSGKGPVDV